MDIRKLQKAVVTALEEVKARDVEVFNVTHLSSLFDRVIIASGESSRQCKALGRRVEEQIKHIGGSVLSVEGGNADDSGEWVLLDLGDVVVHIMQPAVRQYYNLEELWGQPKPRKRAKHEPSRRVLDSSEAKAGWEAAA